MHHRCIYFPPTWLEVWVQCLKVELPVLLIHQHMSTFPEVLPKQECQYKLIQLD